MRPPWQSECPTLAARSQECPADRAEAGSACSQAAGGAGLNENVTPKTPKIVLVSHWKQMGSQMRLKPALPWHRESVAQTLVSAARALKPTLSPRPPRGYLARNIGPAKKRRNESRRGRHECPRPEVFNSTVRYLGPSSLNQSQLPHLKTR